MDIQKIHQYKSSFDSIVKEVKDDWSRRTFMVKKTSRQSMFKTTVVFVECLDSEASSLRHCRQQKTSRRWSDV